MTELQTTPRPRRPRPAVVTLTEAAAERVRALTEAGGHKALRVGLKNAGCAGQEYTFAFADEIGPLDEVVTDKGATIVVDPKSILFLVPHDDEQAVSGLLPSFDHSPRRIRPGSGIATEGRHGLRQIHRW